MNYQGVAFLWQTQNTDFSLWVSLIHSFPQSLTNKSGSYATKWIESSFANNMSGMENHGILGRHVGLHFMWFDPSILYRRVWALERGTDLQVTGLWPIFILMTSIIDAFWVLLLSHQSFFFILTLWMKREKKTFTGTWCEVCSFVENVFESLFTVYFNYLIL